MIRIIVDMYNLKRLAVMAVLLIIIFSSGFLRAAGFQKEIGLTEKLGNKIPLDAVFYDSQGKKVTLGSIINKPTVIDFAYYKCTGICTPLMSEIADVMNRVDLQPGKDYNVVTISFNDDETPKDAFKKKQSMINLLRSGIPASAWWFLTGDSTNIKKVTEAAGFNFTQKEPDNFLHIGVLVFVSANGTICRYVEPGYTTRGNFRILPVSFKMALIEASKGEVIPVIDRQLRYCFTDPPKNESFVIDAFDFSGILILLAVGALYFYVIRKPRKASKKSN